jgi:hypothetical protein
MAIFASGCLDISYTVCPLGALIEIPLRCRIREAKTKAD